MNTVDDAIRHVRCRSMPLAMPRYMLITHDIFHIDIAFAIATIHTLPLLLR